MTSLKNARRKDEGSMDIQGNQKVALFVLLAAVALSFVVMSLWNWLMPALFALHPISFWQALGLLLLSKILFGSFRGRRGSSMHWRGRMMERWAQMTPEERLILRRTHAR
jgi:hypothetical protein